MSVLINGTNGLIQAYDYQVLTTGFSYTFAAGTQVLVINPATTLATGTITMPASPSDGMTITFSTTQQITALTLNGNTGQTVVGGASTMLANTSATYIYRASNTSWFPMQTVPSANTQLGVGQTWQDLTASRTAGTTYTNSTGKPIYVSVTQNQGNSASATLTVNGIIVSYSADKNTNNTTGLGMFVCAIVPAGVTYVYNQTASTISVWAELR